MSALGKRSRGFTLVELVAALTVSGIVVGFVAMFLSAPVQAYMAQRRRAEMTDSAEAATRWIANDVARALPNSLRQGNLQIAELHYLAVRLTNDVSAVSETGG